jgi:3-oxoadipate enol-lactonase
MARIEVNGIQIYFELYGPEEAEVLVLSNGILMSTASWVMQTPVLSRDYRLLLYDCRGMWGSDHPPGPYSMDLHADDLAALLDALDIEQAHIGGTSYGAEISMVFALKYPERTKSLLITSAVSHVDPVLEGLIGGWILASRARDPEMFYQAVYPLTFSGSWIEANQAILADARERYKSIDYAAMLELLLSFSRLDITADLHRITAPALVVVGEMDLLKPRRYAEIIAAEIPDAELVVIPNAGHAALWEQAGIFNTLILGFLAKHALPNRGAPGG